MIDRITGEAVAALRSQTVLPTLFGCVFADIVIDLVDVVDRRCWHWRRRRLLCVVSVV